MPDHREARETGPSAPQGIRYTLGGGWRLEPIPAQPSQRDSERDRRRRRLAMKGVRRRAR